MPSRKSRGKYPSGYIKPILYFDNNGTTFPPPEVIKAVADGMRLGNASAAYATEAQKLLAKFRRKVKSRVANPQAEVIITSGASEAINLFLRSMADLYPKSHFILSAVEHSTSLKCVEQLAKLGRIQYSIVKPRSDGSIHLEDLKKLIRKNTKVVSIMHINNETGSMNDIERLQKYCHSKGIYYFSDTVQSFGKFKIPQIDACCVSFHKMYGPQGIGCLIIDKRILKKGFHAQICGHQNFGYRGGTENLPGISGAHKAMELTFKNRATKNKQLTKKINYIRSEIKKEFREIPFEKYVGKSDKFTGFDDEWTFVQVGGGAPNVLLISFIKPRNKTHFCNIKLKKLLMKKGVAISIGSACSTSVSGSSHVLKAMKAPFIVRCGVIRISVGDHTSLDDCRKLVKMLIESVKIQA